MNRTDFELFDEAPLAGFRICLDASMPTRPYCSTFPGRNMLAIWSPTATEAILAAYWSLWGPQPRDPFATGGSAADRLPGYYDRATARGTYTGD